MKLQTKNDFCWPVLWTWHCSHGNTPCKQCLLSQPDNLLHKELGLNGWCFNSTDLIALPWVHVPLFEWQDNISAPSYHHAIHNWNPITSCSVNLTFWPSSDWCVTVAPNPSSWSHVKQIWVQQYPCNHVCAFLEVESLWSKLFTNV